MKSYLPSKKLNAIRIETDGGGWIEGYYHLGVPHGFQREFGYKVESTGKNPPLHFVGRFYKGIPRGFCWKGLFGGGFICGYVDPVDGSFSGQDLAYIYPDFKTCLRGAFRDARLVRGQLCQLIGSKVENGMYIPVFSKPTGQVILKYAEILLDCHATFFLFRNTNLNRLLKDALPRIHCYLSLGRPLLSMFKSHNFLREEKACSLKWQGRVDPLSLCTMGSA